MWVLIRSKSTILALALNYCCFGVTQTCKKNYTHVQCWITIPQRQWFYCCDENNAYNNNKLKICVMKFFLIVGFDSIEILQLLPWLNIFVVLMWLNPVTKTIYTFNVEPQHHNDDGLIRAMKTMLVNQNNAMPQFWWKHMKIDFTNTISLIWYS